MKIEIAQLLLEIYTREELLEDYDLPSDATDAQIGGQAILWGDANADGTLN